MAATRIIEEERGTYTRTPRNVHQGYYAGDFSNRAVTVMGFARAIEYAEESTTTSTTSRWS